MNAHDEFEAFVRRHQDMVFGSAVRLLGNPADAEDVAQSVFLKAYQRFASVSASESPAAWLKTVTRNACLNHLSRYRKRWKFFSELQRTDEDRDAEFEVEAPAESIALRMEHADERARLEAALRALPEHQRVPLVLYHFEEMSYQDIATTLRVSLGKVKTDIHRGREALRLALMPGPMDPGYKGSQDPLAFPRATLLDRMAALVLDAILVAFVLNIFDVFDEGPGPFFFLLVAYHTTASPAPMSSRCRASSLSDQECFRPSPRVAIRATMSSCSARVRF